MERCPVCRAKLKDASSCYRCGTDLSVPLSIATRAEALEQQAVSLIVRGDLIEAREAIEQALQLKRSPLSLTLKKLIKQAILNEHSRFIERLMP